MVIGVCGVINSGKTSILKKTKSKYHIINIDKLIAKEHEKQKNKIEKIFKTTNKKEIFEQIIVNKELEIILQDILFFNIKKEINLKKSKYDIIILEAANLFATRFNVYTNKVIYIKTSLENCLLNSKKEKKYSKEFVKKIISKQKLENKYSENSDYIFKTTNNLSIDAINFEKLLERII